MPHLDDFFTTFFIRTSILNNNYNNFGLVCQSQILYPKASWGYNILHFAG